MSSMITWLDAALLLYGVIITVVLFRAHARDQRREDECIEMIELLAQHRKLVNELQTIGEDEATVVLDWETRRKLRED